MHEDQGVQHQPIGNLDPSDLSRWLVQASPDGLWVFDEHGMTVFANDRMGELLVRSSEQMRTLSVYDCLDEQGKADLALHLAQLKTTRTSGSNLECQFRCGDGSTIWALVSHTPIRDDDGDHVGWLHRVTEYSEQRRLIDTLKHREKQLGEAQRIAQIGSWEWEVVRDKVTWSDELFRLYGVDPTKRDELSARSFVNLLHPDDRAEVHRAVTGANPSNNEFQFDARVVRSEGPVLWVRGRGLVSFAPDGNVLRMEGTAQDITATKDAEQALALLSAMATTANQATRLVDVVPSIIADVAIHTGWRSRVRSERRPPSP
jgi:PAS domain S-box-containing protein